MRSPPMWPRPVQAGSLEATLQTQQALLTSQALTLQAPQAPAPSATLAPPATDTLPAPTATQVIMETATQVMMATATQAMIATATWVPTLTATWVPTPSSATPTLVPTVMITPTNLPTITATINTNCRSGTSTEYPRVGSLLVGQVSTVHGRNSSSTWWYIANPSKPASFCWVWTETTVVTGNTSTLPVVTPPPLPKLAYRISFSNRHQCSGGWFFTFKVANTGEIFIRSARITIIDQDSGKKYGPDSFNSPFSSSADSCKSGTFDLAPNDAGFLITDLGAKLKPGTPVRALILLCSQDGLNGACLETRLDFKAP